MAADWGIVKASVQVSIHSSIPFIGKLRLTNKQHVFFPYISFLTNIGWSGEAIYLDNDISWASRRQ